MSRFQSPSRLVLVGMVGLLGLLASACDSDTTVNPFVEGENYFTLYGYLDTAIDTQYVRVVTLRKTIGTETDPNIDAQVTSTALENGVVTAWEDSVVTYEDGSLGHVFHAPFRPIPGWTYRIDVMRSDGKQSSVQTTIPLATLATVDPPVVSGSFANQRVFWNGIDFPPFRVEVWYRFMSSQPYEPFLNATLTYADDKLGNQLSDGWEVAVRLSDDREDIAQKLNVSGNAALPLMGLGMRLTMSDEQWRPPGGVFDPEILVQPGTFSNVENGFGFVGAVNQYVVEWTLDEDTVERIGFRFPGKKGL